jgi:UDP-N-acetyl-D-glucosamine dehydrogenase
MPDEYQNLISKLTDKTACIGVLGLGYVGLPLCLRFSEAGYKVIGFDVDAGKIEKLNSGRRYFSHYGDDLVAAAVSRDFSATADFARAAEADALIICVPTPLKEHREPDISFVTNTMDSLLPHLRNGQVVSLESTTYPGTTEEELRPRIQSTGSGRW